MPEPTSDLAAEFRQIIGEWGEATSERDVAALAECLASAVARRETAALERQAELEGALLRIEALAEAGMPAATQWMHDASDLIRIREVARKALLARSAAEEHVGSFFASEYGNPNVPPTGWHWTCSCGESSGRLYRERTEAVSGHNAHRSAALLARPTAEGRSERG